MCEDFLQAGLKVLIKRNDGRTHHAIISNINYNTRYVAVEWFEGGETKGKEVDFDSLFDLNPQLVEDGERRNVKAEAFRKEGRKRTCMSMPSRSKSAAEKNRDHVGDHSRNRTKLPRTSSSLSLDKIPTSPVKRRENDSRLSSKLRKTNGPSPIRELKAEISPTKPAPKRKSSTVKEIEKLQKNRELRRMKQAEKKEEREALLTTHSGNPNWQFQAMIRDYQEKMDFKPLTDTDEVTENHQITVCVRKRPLNRKEKLAKEVDVISVPRRNIVVVHEPKNKVDLTKYLENQQFRFDYIFDEMCNNETVYNFTAKPLVETVFEGGMATCFAYGQTGSGKTHTMSGATKTGEKGIYAMVAVDVFKYLKYPVNEEKKLAVSASYYEIYGGKVYDLLAKNARLRVLEDGKQQVQIVGLTEKVVQSYEEVLNLIVCGNNARTSGRTSANSCSSRSHAIFQITLRQLHGQNIYGRIHLIDLAGNERGADTSSASRVTRLEGAEINKSLLALKECIRALGRKGSHLPFRGSTLTLVLRDSFIGDKTKTCMIAMISPGMSSCEHTINTLRYADRVKELGSTELIDQPEEKQKPGWPSIKEYESEEEPSIGLGSSKSPRKSEIPPSICEKSNKLQHLEQEMVEAFEKWTKLCPKFDTSESQLLLTRAIDILRHAGKTRKLSEEKRKPEWRSNMSESDTEEDFSLGTLFIDHLNTVDPHYTGRAILGSRTSSKDCRQVSEIWFDLSETDKRASRTANGPTSYAETNKAQHLELQMLGAFQLWTQLCSKFNQMDAQLLLQAHQLQYDPWQFTSELDRVLAERQKFLTGLRDRVTAFRLQISETNK